MMEPERFCGLKLCGDGDPGIRVEEDTPVDSDASDRIRASYSRSHHFGMFSFKELQVPDSSRVRP
jgi:hypothetical protein